MVEEKIKDCHLLKKELDKEAPARAQGNVSVEHGAVQATMEKLFLINIQNKPFESKVDTYSFIQGGTGCRCCMV